MCPLVQQNDSISVQHDTPIRQPLSPLLYLGSLSRKLIHTSILMGPFHRSCYRIIISSRFPHVFTCNHILSPVSSVLVQFVRLWLDPQAQSLASLTRSDWMRIRVYPTAGYEGLPIQEQHAQLCSWPLGKGNACTGTWVEYHAPTFHISDLHMKLLWRRRRKESLVF